MKFSLTVNTHVHADHVTGTGKLKELYPHFKSVLSKASGGLADIWVEDGQIINFGEQVSQTTWFIIGQIYPKL